MPNDCVNDKYCADRRETCEKIMQVKFNALKEIFETKNEATEKALNLANEVLNERMKKANEIRQMAIDREINFVSKPAFDAQVINIEQLRLSEAKLAGKADSIMVMKVDKRAEEANNRGNIALIIAALSILISIAIHFIK